MFGHHQQDPSGKLEPEESNQANCWNGAGGAGVNARRQLLKPLWLLALAGLLVASSALLAANCQEQLTVESRQQKDNDDLNDAIKYLEKLDKYFSQMARPRFGRSELKQPALRSFQADLPSETAGGGRIAFQTRYGGALDLAAARLAQRYRDGLAY